MSIIPPKRDFAHTSDSQPKHRPGRSRSKRAPVVAVLGGTAAPTPRRASFSKSQAAALSRWQDAVATIADPAVELDVETFADLLRAFIAAEAVGVQTDPGLHALMVALSRQIIDIDPDGDSDVSVDDGQEADDPDEDLSVDDGFEADDPDHDLSDPDGLGDYNPLGELIDTDADFSGITTDEG